MIEKCTSGQGWNVETLRQYIADKFEAHDKLFQANDRRYTELGGELKVSIKIAFEAQRVAMEQGFATQKDAIQTALNAAEKAVNAALVSADRAVTKAEAATEKRFENVNEFRSALSDRDRSEQERSLRVEQTFLPKNEAKVLMDAMRALLDVQKTDIQALTVRINNWESKKVGASEGVKDFRDYIGWGIAAVLGLIALVQYFRP